MIEIPCDFYLASQSPRRRSLLGLLGFDFNTFAVDLNEEILDGEHPIRSVERLASDKMTKAASIVNDSIILTADTIVVLDGDIIGKPSDEADAFRILKLLSGNTHTVYTGFCLLNQNNRKKIVDFEKTDVTFRDLSDSEIRDYIASGSPMDKAGAYGIQEEFGAVFVTRIDGCYYNVVGLPLSKIYSSLLNLLKID